MNENSDVVKILHVSLQYEADTAVATLEAGGVPAYSKPTPDGSLLRLRSTMGINSTGYDIFVTAADSAKADEILRGIGYSSEMDSQEAEEDEGVGAQQDDSEADTVSEEQEEQKPLTDEDRRAALQKSIEELPKWKWTLYKIVFALMFFAAVYLLVVVCDSIIEIIKGLF